MALIPHAGKQYAGKARVRAFEAFTDRPVSAIVYVATLHRHIRGDSHTYIIHRDPEFPEFAPELGLPSSTIQEHSFSWVEEELRARFPGAKVLVVAPSPKAHLTKLCQAIVAFLDGGNDRIVLGTTDLIHYGQSYGTQDVLDGYVQEDKIRREEGLLRSLVGVNVKGVRKAIREPILSCGPRAIETLVRVAKLMKWKGRVVDYYDSYGVMQTGKLNRYTINVGRVPSFVSYASVTFGAYPKPVLQSLLPIDINLGLGAVKTVIRAMVYHKQVPSHIIPSWSSLHAHRNGVFVGTSKGGYTNCCYGRYEDTTSLAQRIPGGAADCPGDAKNRWMMAYSEKDIDKMSYQLEILDLHDEWKSYPSREAPTVFPWDGEHGMLLTLHTGRAATYLPVVARERLEEWDVETYMNELSKKAGSLENYRTAWRHPDSRMQIYRSRQYKSY